MAAAASDKARFYLEQDVPELQEYSRKGIFSSAEITAIAAKRSEFEHLINMAGAATAADYARYATYEMNLDALRKKRSKRLGVKSTMYTGQKKVFFVLDRAVRRYQGDMGLWMQYLEYCRQETANKKLAKALTQCLRLHPLKWELWVWAARHYVEQQADMTSGRSYMQRGLRFCSKEKNLWLQYAKLEMLYVAKISARRKILGLDEERVDKQVDEGYDADADMIALPDVTAEDINPELKGETESVDADALQKLASTPALSGAIPKTIMLTAMKNFNNDPILAEQFFDLFLEFIDVPSTSALLEHITLALEENKKEAAASLAYCRARIELLGIEATSAEFPTKLGRALETLKKARESNPADEAAIASRAIIILLPYLKHKDEMDEVVAKVLDASVKQHIRLVQAPNAKSGTKARKVLFDLKQRLQRDKNNDASTLSEYGLVDSGA